MVIVGTVLLLPYFMKSARIVFTPTLFKFYPTQILFYSLAELTYLQIIFKKIRPFLWNTKKLAEIAWMSKQKKHGKIRLERVGKDENKW